MRRRPSEHGSAIFGPLAVLIGGIWGAQAVMVIACLVALYALTRRSPWDFLKRGAPLYATTAATFGKMTGILPRRSATVAALILPCSFQLPRFDSPSLQWSARFSRT